MDTSGQNKSSLEEIMTERAAWKVDFTLPRTEDRRWVQNKNVTVVTESLERVVKIMRDHYPDCTLVAIHRVGSERQVIVDNG